MITIEERAIRLLSGIGSGNATKALDILEDAIAVAASYGDDNGTLRQWLTQRKFDGSETTQALADEWDLHCEESGSTHD
jgi:hypothetical protein